MLLCDLRLVKVMWTKIEPFNSVLHQWVESLLINMLLTVEINW